MISVADIPPPVRVREFPPDRRLWWAMWGLIGVGIVLTLLLMREGNILSAAETKQLNRPGLLGCGPGQPCDHLLRSEYAVILGKSLTKWGLGYYLLVAAAILAAIYAWQLSLSPPLSLMLPVVTLIGVVAGGWCVAVMWKLAAFCPWCLAVHGVNLMLFGVALLYAVQDWRHRQYIRWEAGVPPLPSTPVAIHVVVALMLGTGQVMMMTLFHADPKPRAEVAAKIEHGLGTNPWTASGSFAQFAIDAPKPAQGAIPIWTVKGPRDAPHRLVVFSCLTCPKCKELNSVLKEVMSRHPGKLRVDVRFYPLWHGCNPTIPKGAMDTKHREACPLIRNALGVAMLKPDAFAEYVDWLYENQSTLDDTQATSAAHKRVDKSGWQKAMDDPALWRRMREDIELARQLDIHTVPQIYMDQGQIYGGINVRNLESLLSESFAWKASENPSDDEGAVWVADNFIVAHAQRGLAHAQGGRYADAIRELKESLRLKGDWAEAAQHLAWILATCPDDTIRNGTEAVKYAKLAQRNSKTVTPQLWDVVAAALAEAGEYQEAVNTARKSLELYKQAGSEKQAEEVDKRMQMYLAGRAYRTPK
ncbi:MAG: thioredoxin domain-containing protein [Planctomycetes bacterium]|nr:thioredoxin domain-containing protein [Planctomycetota bacterium]